MLSRWIVLAVVSVVFHCHWFNCTTHSTITKSRHRQKNKNLTSNAVPSIRTHHRRETPTTRIGTTTTQPGNRTASPQSQSARSSSRNSHMDHRPSTETTSGRGSRSMASKQTRERTTPYGQPRTRGTCIDSPNHGTSSPRPHHQTSRNRSTKKTTTAPSTTTIYEYFNRASTTRSNSCLPVGVEQPSHDRLCPQLQTNLQKKNARRQTVGMERDLRHWFGRQQAQGLHGDAGATSARDLETRHSQERHPEGRQELEKDHQHGASVETKRCRRGKRGRRGGRRHATNTHEGNQERTKIRALRYRRARAKANKQQDTTQTHNDIHQTHPEPACTVASPCCTPAEPSVSALPDAQMKSFTNDEPGSQAIPRPACTTRVRKQTLLKAARSVSEGRAVHLHGKHIDASTWASYFPGIPLPPPKEPPTPKIYKKRKRPGQNHRHTETLVSFNVLSAKEDSHSNKCAGRWHLLETVFHQHKVDIAMLQGTMELGTYKTIGQHYVIHKHGQQTWSPGCSTGVAIMIHKTKQNHKIRVRNISGRLLFVEVKTSNRHDVYGSAYAPGEWDTEAKRTHFYNQLLSSMQALPARAIKHIGIDNNGAVNWCQPWTGRCTVQSDASPNGQALLDVCEASSLTLANKFVQDPHPCTCYTYGNNQEHSNQIDYIALDCRTKPFHALTKPEWPVHLRTDGRYDHIPVLAKVACHKPSKADKIPQTLWNWPAFQDPQVLRRFKEDLAKVQQEQQQHTDSIDEHWHWLRQELYALQQKHFTKPAGGIRKPYISDQTKSLIHQKAKALRNLRIAREELDSNTDDMTYRTNFEQYQAHLKTSNKQVRQAVTADKIRWVEALGQEAEQAAARNDFRTVFAIERRLCGRKRKAAKTHVKLDSGQPALTENAEQLAWLQHGLRVFKRGSGSKPKQKLRALPFGFVCPRFAFGC